MKTKLLRHLRKKYQILIEDESVIVIYKHGLKDIRMGAFKPTNSLKELHAELEYISLETFYRIYKDDWYLRQIDNLKMMFKT